MTLLHEDDELFEDLAHELGVGAVDGDLVAPYVDVGFVERALDLAQQLVARPEERGHEVVARDTYLH